MQAAARSAAEEHAAGHTDRHGRSEPMARLSADDELEIPAFLRRQVG